MAAAAAAAESIVGTAGIELVQTAVRIAQPVKMQMTGPAADALGVFLLGCLEGQRSLVPQRKPETAPEPEPGCHMLTAGRIV